MRNKVRNFDLPQFSSFRSTTTRQLFNFFPPDKKVYIGKLILSTSLCLFMANSRGRRCPGARHVPLRAGPLCTSSGKDFGNGDNPQRKAFRRVGDAHGIKRLSLYIKCIPALRKFIISNMIGGKPVTERFILFYGWTGRG